MFVLELLIFVDDELVELFSLFDDEDDRVGDVFIMLVVALVSAGLCLFSSVLPFVLSLFIEFISADDITTGDAVVTKDVTAFDMIYLK